MLFPATANCHCYRFSPTLASDPLAPELLHFHFSLFISLP